MTLVHPSAVISPGANLGAGVQVGPYSVIGPNVTLGAGTVIMAHVVLDGWTTIGAECRIFPFACIGTQTQDLKYKGGKTFAVIGDRTTLREYVTVNSGSSEGEVTRVGSGCHIMAYSHVAHGCTVGNEVVMSNCSTLAGHVIIEDQAVIGGLTGIHQFVRVGRMCMVGGMTGLTQDAPPYMLVAGHPPSIHGLNKVALERRGVGAEARDRLKQCNRILFRETLSTVQAISRIRSEVAMCPEVEHLLSFVENSSRGIVKNSDRDEE